MTAAMIGFGKRSIREVRACPRATNMRNATSGPAATATANSLISAPALKARPPAPVTITARMASSSSIAAKSSMNRSIKA